MKIINIFRILINKFISIQDKLIISIQIDCSIVDSSETQNNNSLMISVQKQEQIPYVCSKFLGKGTFADVYLGTNKENGKPYAVKKILLGACDQLPQGQVCKQLSRLRSLKGDHIIQYYESYKVDNELWIIMKLCNGSLRDMMKAKPIFTARQLIQITVQITSAMEILNQNNTLHLDLKPENILNTGDKINLRLSDFGCAQLTEKGSFSKFVFSQINFGTQSYIAPEIKLSKHGSHKSSQDVFSLGVIIYELLYRQKPVSNNSQQIHDLWEEKRFIKYPRVTQDKRNLLSLVKQMLQINPMRRPTWKQVMKRLINESNIQKVEFLPVIQAYQTHKYTTELFILKLRQLEQSLHVHSHPFWQDNKNTLIQMKKIILVLLYLYSIKFKELFQFKFEGKLTENQLNQLKFYQTNFIVELKKSTLMKNQKSLTLADLEKYQDQFTEIVNKLTELLHSIKHDSKNWKSLNNFDTFCSQAINVPTPSFFCCVNFFPKTLQGYVK